MEASVKMTDKSQRVFEYVESYPKLCHVYNYKFYYKQSKRRVIDEYRKSFSKVSFLKIHDNAACFG